MLRRISLGLFLSCALAGCGGGGGSSTPAAALPPTAASTGPQNVAISIAIPATTTASASASRHAQYVSINTKSAVISVNGGPPVVTNLSAGSSTCTTPSGGGARTCTVSVSAPVGSDTFNVALYANTTGTGTALSQNTVMATILSGIANTVKLTLDGVVSAVTLSLQTTNPPVGTVLAADALTVNLEDASGASIVGSDPLANPVTLTDSDTSGATTLSKTTLNTPADATGLSVKYSGAAISQAVFGATATGLASSSVTTATLTPQAASASAMVDWPTYAYDNTRSGFNPYTTGITPASIGNLKVAWQTAINGSTQTQPIVLTSVAGQKDPLLIVADFAVAQAYDALTGKRVWSTTLPVQNVQDCGVGGISGTAVYDKALSAVFMAAGATGSAAPNHVVLYRLDAGTGAIQESVDVTPASTLLPGEANYSHTGVTLANGRIYLGTGSDCEGTVTGAYPSWRGRVVSVDPSSMTLEKTFYTTWGQNGTSGYGGGGVWAWGGVSSDANGNVFVSAGNAETAGSTNPQSPSAPFVAAPNEQVGYAEHLVELSSDLSTVENSNYPGFNFTIGYGDLDYTGVPVVYQPPATSGCGELTATQGKGGTLVVNNASNLAVDHMYDLSVPSGGAYYVGNPAYSPVTGYLYAAITSSGAGSAMLQPGMAAISGCGSTMQWHTAFGPDSTLYTNGENPRSAPTVTAGGVVFMGTPCTSANNGTACGTPSGNPGGALWALDASAGTLLHNGTPLLVTGDNIRMAPSADGLWLWVLDDSGNFYGLTVDPTVQAIKVRPGVHVTNQLRARGRG